MKRDGRHDDDFHAFRDEVRGRREHARAPMELMAKEKEIWFLYFGLVFLWLFGCFISFYELKFPYAFISVHLMSE